MLKKYNDFLFESLILESVVVYSDKFRELLKKIDSPVSQALLDFDSMDLKVSNNYLDVNDKETISFITDRKAQEILNQKDKFAIYVGGSGFLKHSEANSEIFELLEYEPIGDSTYHPQNGEKGEILKKAQSPNSGNVYVKIKFPGGLTVINETNLRAVNVELLPFEQNRQTIRIGRGIKGILNATDQKFTDSDIEQFVNKYKSAWDEMNDIFRKFELVSGEKIAFWYNYQNYAEQRGTMGSSCMRHVRPDFFDIYVKNPDKVSLLILKSDDDQKIKARALVWNLDNPKVTFVDRIYTNDDSDVNLFKQYADSKGWYYKRNQNSSNDRILIGKDSVTLDEGPLLVTLLNENNGGYRNYPYLDTLKYFNTSSGELTTQDKRGHSYVITLEDTGGRWIEDGCDTCDGDGRVDCPECEGSCEINCSDCYSRSARRSTGKVECDECSGAGEMDCDDCEGQGEIDGESCGLCEGSGKKQCDDCDGDGEVDCDECGGRGEYECGNCDGDGRVDCPDCQ